MIAGEADGVVFEDFIGPVQGVVGAGDEELRAVRCGAFQAAGIIETSKCRA